MEQMDVVAFINEVFEVEGVLLAIGPPVNNLKKSPRNAISYKEKFAGKIPMDGKLTGAKLVRRALKCLDDNYCVQIVDPVYRHALYVAGRNAPIASLRERRERLARKLQ